MVELTEFADFTCPLSRNTRAVLASVLHTFPDQITYVYRHFPKPNCEEAFLAAVAAEAAKRQNQFWPMYHALFFQHAINPNSVAALAQTLGLDMDWFLTDLHNAELHQFIETDRQDGQELGVCKTPTLLVNGHRFYGHFTQARLSPLIRQQVTVGTRPILDTVDPHTGIIRWAGE